MNSHFDERPYVQMIDEVEHIPENITAWLVDGLWVRKYIQREFTNFAHHDTKPRGIGGDAFEQIPEHEFWFDQAVKPEEVPYFLDHLLVEHFLMTERGYNYQKAEQEGIKVEERERHRTRFKGERKFDINPELSLIQKAGNLEIYLVNGKVVRDKIDPRFVAGGHSDVYGYIPDHHVWIDDASLLGDRPFYILHEVHEFRDMEIGKDYLDAHKTASRIEWKCRHNPQELLRQQKQLGL